ncbi:MAG: putative Zn-dependent hydrolase [Candidatus Kaiserbacteria bacterium]|nr:putative Zn-dependent hydrolase [Candidatus Kaiserbacteria bacterium]
MKITKLGHCCLLIEDGGKTILTDPGNYSDTQNTIKGIDIVVITHEHGDHLHVDSLKAVLGNNLDATVVCNSAVGRILDKEGIKYQVIEGIGTAVVKDVAIEACDGRHEEIFEEIGQVQNTGYMLMDRLYYPGDSFTAPQKQIEILALPVGGPWCKLPDALHFMLRVMPKKVFPVHDGMLKSAGMLPLLKDAVFGKHNIELVMMGPGDSNDF